MNRSLSIRGENRHRRPVATRELHAHRWRIDEPDGPTSEGRCGCGETRQFANWQNDHVSDPKAWRLDKRAAGGW